MTTVINARDLRLKLGDVVRQVRKGGRFTVLYRSRAAFEIVPPGLTASTGVDLAADPLYRAEPVGRSAAGMAAREHDQRLYP